MFREAVKKAIQDFEGEERFWCKLGRSPPDSVYKTANVWKNYIFDTRYRSKHMQLREI